MVADAAAGQMESAEFGMLGPLQVMRVSARVGNYQDSPFYGPLVDQMWVR